MPQSSRARRLSAKWWVQLRADLLCVHSRARGRYKILRSGIERCRQQGRGKCRNSEHSAISAPGLQVATDLHREEACFSEEVPSPVRLLWRPAGLPVGATAFVAGLQLEITKSATPPNAAGDGRTLTPSRTTLPVRHSNERQTKIHHVRVDQAVRVCPDVSQEFSDVLNGNAVSCVPISFECRPCPGLKRH